MKEQNDGLSMALRYRPSLSFLSRPRIFLLSLCLLAPLASGQDTHQQNAVTLETGPQLEREIGAGTDKLHIYQVVLAANQSATITIEQRGVDVLAQVYGPDGQMINEVDAVTAAQGAENVKLASEAAGTYRIEVKPSLAKAGLGNYSIQLSEQREATVDDKALELASRSLFGAQRLNLEGKFIEALAAANRALEIRERLLGPESEGVAEALLSVGLVNLSKVSLAPAEKALQRAAEITEKSKGIESLEYAEILSRLGQVRFRQGNLAEAERMANQSLMIRERLAGPDSALAAKPLLNLAAVYRSSNNIPKAEQTYLKALTIRERLLGEDHLAVSEVLSNLGLLYYGAGGFPNAERCLQRALSIREKALHPNHWQVAVVLNNLGLVAWKKGDLAKAKEYYLRALPIYVVAGVESDGVASISHNLGIIYKEEGDKVEAERHYRRALEIWEKIFGEDNTSTANALSSLAILYRMAGDYDRAEPLDLRALASREKFAGPYNNYTVLSLRSLVKLYAAKGDVSRALEYQKRLQAIDEKILPLNFSIGSEQQKIAYNEQLEPLDRKIAFHASLAPENELAVEFAATAILQRKGRILDALSDSLSALRRRLDPQDRTLLEQIGEVHSRLARLLLSGRQGASPEEYQRQLAALEAEGEKLESEIGRRSSGFYEGSKPVTLAAIRAEIPPDCALIEFAAYRPFDWKGSNEEASYGEPHYIAYVLRREGAVQWKELGAAKPIDAVIDEWRKLLADPKRQDATQLARALDEKVMQPLRSIAGEATHFLLSPDGALSLIPFEALVDEKGDYLVQNYSFSYLTSGRDLLRMKVTRASKSKDLLVANPRFGEASAGQLIAANKVRGASDRKSKSVIITRSLSDTYFAPLSGTLQEARSIQALFPDAVLLTGTAATEAALKQANAPRILHVATHGYFLSETPSTAKDSPPQNPLLRSGLALANANQHGSKDGSGDDGILTALEASGLSLWGTKLAVLSACDTGVGEVHNGEGVYGLRRAFVLAGSESLVMSLWPVSDYSTRRLMADYYKNLKQGQGRGEALRSVQLQLLKANPKLHPFYWANFIQAGEWANLDGKRR